MRVYRTFLFCVAGGGIGPAVVTAMTVTGGALVVVTTAVVAAVRGGPTDLREKGTETVGPVGPHGIKTGTAGLAGGMTALAARAAVRINPLLAPMALSQSCSDII